MYEKLNAVKIDILLSAFCFTPVEALHDLLDNSVCGHQFLNSKQVV